MKAQLPNRIKAMEEEFGGKWDGEVVTYDKDKAIPMMEKKYGVSREKAIELLKLEGFTFSE
jgi:hypothetical protein